MNRSPKMQRADQRRLELGRRVRVHRLDVGAGARVDERPAVARHPAGQALAAAEAELLEQLRVGPGGESAAERVVRIRIEEQRARRERHEVGQLRRDERHRVRDAQARAHRLRDLVERVDLAMRERDVVEHRALALGRRGADGPDPFAATQRSGTDAGRLELFLLDLGAQPRHDARERRHDAGVERLAGVLLENRQRRVGADRPVVRAVRRQRIEIVNDAENAGPERDLFLFQPGRIAASVPPLVVAQDERRHRVRERDAGDDVGAHLRVNANLLELFGCQRTRLGEDVLRHGELADVVQERSRPDRLDFVLAHAERASHARRVRLYTSDVVGRALVLRVDRQRQRFDRGHLQIRHLPRVVALLFEARAERAVDADGEEQDGDRHQHEAGDHP